MSNPRIDRSNEIDKLIASNSLERAMKQLLDYASDFAQEKSYIREALVISGAFYNMDIGLKSGQIDWQKAQQERKALMHQMLELKDSILEYPRRQQHGQ